MAAVSSAAAAATGAAPGTSTDFWSQLQQKKVAGIGGNIPGAGVYLQQQAQAEQAFQDAQAQAQAQKNRSFQQFGLLSSGEVDPNSQYGDYQNLLHDQAAQFNQANELAQQRHIGGTGLGAQGETDLRYGANAADLAFQRQVEDAAQAERTTGQSALSARNAAFLDAQQAALANADAQAYAAQAAAGGSAGGGSGGATNGNSSDWIYGATLPPGYSGETLLSQAAGMAPSYGGVRYVPAHIMNQGMIQNGMYSVKFIDPTGKNPPDTIWIPLPPKDGGDDNSASAPAPEPAATNQPRQNAPKPPTTQTAVRRLASSSRLWKPV